jgi:hypothetical protein
MNLVVLRYCIIAFAQAAQNRASTIIIRERGVQLARSCCIR